MNAPVLLVLFDAAYLIALAAWIGAILFFSFGVAPIIFKVLAPESAAKFVRALFPRYYAWGATCGAIALPAYLGAPLSFQEFRGPMVAVQSLLIMAGTLVMFYCGQSLTPAINAARDAGPAEKARFDRLHRRSVRLNGAVLLIGLGLFLAYAYRGAPKTAGIVEPGPVERALRDERAMQQIDAELRAKARADREGRPSAR